MKIENRIKKNQAKGLTELGNFCAQYGYERLSPLQQKQKRLLKEIKLLELTTDLLLEKESLILKNLQLPLLTPQ